MDKVIIYTNNYGGVSVCIPTGELPIEEVQRKDIPSGIQSYIVPINSLPSIYDDFFDAWEQSNGVVTVNFAKAKELTKARLRIEREPLLKEQDILFMRALELGQDTTQIVTEKERLRSITSLADTATTLDELRNIKVV